MPFGMICAWHKHGYAGESRKVESAENSSPGNRWKSLTFLAARDTSSVRPFRDRIRQTSQDFMKRTLVRMITFVAALTAWAAVQAQTPEITIMVNQAAVSGVRELAAGYEKATGRKVVVDFTQQQDQKIRTDAAGDL